MPRLMSVRLTEDAVRERRKDVTRRLGWRAAQPGVPLTLVRQAMGRTRRLPNGTKVVDPLVVVAQVEVVSARWEPLNLITDDDVRREGFGPDQYPVWWSGWQGWTPAQRFVEFFTESMRCAPDTPVNRIEWRYLE